MSRKRRSLPHPGCLVEIRQRTFQGRPFLRADEELGQRLTRVLARSQSMTEMAIHAVALEPNQMHLLIAPMSSAHLARFMCHLKTNLSKEIGRLHGWSGPLFGGPYKMKPIAEDDASQLKSLRRVLARGHRGGFAMVLGMEQMESLLT